jgi:MFS family permease
VAAEPSGDLTRLILLVGGAVLLDTTFYAVVAPLLPGLSHSLGLSKLGAGVLTACYPAGMLLASVPGGLLAIRFGARVAVCAGLGLLFCSTVAFALLHSAAGLDAARFVEGVGGACSWDGGIAWLVVAAPAHRRGTVIGQAVSAAIAGSIAGSIAGPAVGALASAIGRGALFIALASLALGLVVLTWRLRVPSAAESSGPATGRNPLGEGEADPGSEATRPAAAIGALLGRPVGRGAIWLMTLPAIVSGTLTVLGPLALHPLGAGAGIIGATFIVAAGLESIVSAWVGGISDRHGRLVPLVGSFVAAGAGLVLFGVAHSVPALVVVIGVTAVGTGAAWTPAMALLSDLSDAVGLNQAYGAGLMNIAWAAGQIIGSLGSGAAARAIDNTVPTVAVGVLCLLSAAAVLRAHTNLERPAGARGAGDGAGPLS